MHVLSQHRGFDGDRSQHISIRGKSYHLCRPFGDAVRSGSLPVVYQPDVTLAIGGHAMRRYQPFMVRTIGRICHIPVGKWDKFSILPFRQRTTSMIVRMTRKAEEYTTIGCDGNTRHVRFGWHDASYYFKLLG